MTPLGSVLSVQGSQAKIGLSSAGLGRPDQARATVGMFLGIHSGTSLLIGMITEVTLETSAAAREQGARATARIDLMGEIKARDNGAAAFRRGVTAYPAIGDSAVLLSGRELQLIYTTANTGSIDIGHHQQDSSTSAAVNLDDMLSKHFAVLGTTGVGKSSGVALILQQILEKRPALRIFLLDGHNEYARCFGARAHVLNPGNVKLPFWLFNFEETIDILYGARGGVDEEVEILSEVIPLAKGSYTQYRGGGTEIRALKKTDPRTTGYTVDTPVPYRLADLIALIDERMGKLENRTSRMKFHRLMQRIEAVSNDPRYGFMFENANVGGDTMAESLSELFRLPPNGKPMTIMQLAGFPTEVVNAVVSVLCRMAFEFGLWSDGAVPLLFICEEAHRYASVDPKVGFGPTRRALARIAKEGRKYGVFLGLVTQRPAELDPTIISQCSTLSALRMANERDQALLRSAVADAGSSLLDFLPSLGTGEALAFGEGVPLPTRFKFKTLPQHLIPASESVNNARIDANRSGDPDFLESVIERWRSATMSHKQGPDLAPAGGDPVSRIDPATLHTAPGAALDPNRLRPLRRATDMPPATPQFTAPPRPNWPPR